MYYVNILKKKLFLEHFNIINQEENKLYNYKKWKKRTN